MKQKKKQKLLPFDARNEADYYKLTDQIESALQKIESDGRIPATQNKLADLAKCSRKTLNNRKYPIERLNQIKTDRKLKSLKAVNTKNLSSTSIPDDSDSFKTLINNYQNEMGLLFNRLQDIEEQNKELKRLNDFYEEEVKSTREENVKLFDKLRKLENSSLTLSNVISINRDK